jgi:hypothetical protein
VLGPAEVVGVRPVRNEESAGVVLLLKISRVLVLVTSDSLLGFRVPN